MVTVLVVQHYYANRLGRLLDQFHGLASLHSQFARHHYHWPDWLQASGLPLDCPGDAGMLGLPCKCVQAASHVGLRQCVATIFVLFVFGCWCILRPKSNWAFQSQDEMLRIFRIGLVYQLVVADACAQWRQRSLLCHNLAH